MMLHKLRIALAATLLALAAVSAVDSASALLVATYSVGTTREVTSSPAPEPEVRNRPGPSARPP
jgi:hypothetical protein